MEWYDFAVYAHVVPIVAGQVFPSDDTGINPIAVLPTHEQIGLAAPLLLILLRLLQGISVGGAYTSSMSVLVESAAASRRAINGCWCLVGATLGTLLGSAIADLLSNIPTAEAMTAWGWRIPFLFGLLLGAAGFVLLPLFALLSDRFGRKPVMAAGIVGVAVSAYPRSLLLHSGDATLALLGEVIFAAFVALTCVSLPPIMAESSPRPVRVTAVSVAYNTPFAIAGGTAPLVAQCPIGESGNPFAPAYYSVAAVSISLVALLTIRETRWRPIPE